VTWVRSTHQLVNIEKEDIGYRTGSGQCRMNADTGIGAATAAGSHIQHKISDTLPSSYQKLLKFVEF